MRPYPSHTLSHNSSGIVLRGYTGLESTTKSIPKSYTTWVKERRMTSHTSKTSVGWCEILLKKSITNGLRLLTTGSFEVVFVPEGL